MARRKSRKRRSRESRSKPTPARQQPAAKKSKILFGAAFAAVFVVASVAIWVIRGSTSGGSAVNVEVPALSAKAQLGSRTFDANCVPCHGPNASGTDKGPPLVHRIYEPSHHGDASIRRAVRLGVQPHHWRFGSMPKIALSDRELDGVIAYIRELQRANGIL